MKKYILIIVMAFLLTACTSEQAVEKGESDMAPSSHTSAFVSDISSESSKILTQSSDIVLNPNVSLPNATDIVNLSEYKIHDMGDETTAYCKYINLVSGTVDTNIVDISIELYSKLNFWDTLGKGKQYVSGDKVNIFTQLLHATKHIDRKKTDSHDWIKSHPGIGDKIYHNFTNESDINKTADEMLCSDCENIYIDGSEYYIESEKLYATSPSSRFNGVIFAILNYKVYNDKVEITLVPFDTYSDDVSREGDILCMYNSETDDHLCKVGYYKKIKAFHSDYGEVTIDKPVLDFNNYDKFQKTKVTFCISNNEAKIHRIDYIK